MSIIQELLGHKDVSATMIYTHVLNRGGRGVASPLDSHIGRGTSPSLSVIPRIEAPTAAPYGAAV